MPMVNQTDTGQEHTDKKGLMELDLSSHKRDLSALEQLVPAKHELEDEEHIPLDEELLLP
ncbi:MAG: hypothetical protein K0Q90_3832, partial [Paenibacillaceae bacterium]|nr:hypothetical protein [Paenibacillaceae bacterium]